MTNDRRLPLGAIIISVVPVAALVATLVCLSRVHFDVVGYERYLRYREFWGGNPHEVFSHWLDMVLMSGNAAALKPPPSDP